MTSCPLSPNSQQTLIGLVLDQFRPSDVVVSFQKVMEGLGDQHDPEDVRYMLTFLTEQERLDALADDCWAYHVDQSIHDLVRELFTDESVVLTLGDAVLKGGVVSEEVDDVLRALNMSTDLEGITWPDGLRRWRLRTSNDDLRKRALAMQVVPDERFTAQMALEEAARCISRHGAQGWTVELASLTRCWCQYDYQRRVFRVSGFLVPRKVTATTFRQAMLRMVAHALAGRGGPWEAKAREIGYTGFEAPQLVNPSERRWKLKCRCGAKAYVQVLTAKVRNGVCRSCKGPMKAKPNKHATVPTVSRKAGRKRQRVFSEDEDGYVSGCPPECYDDEGRFIAD